MRVAIIGGAGRVGATTAFHLFASRLVSKLVLIDVMEDVVRGEREDLIQCTSVIDACDIRAATKMEACAGSDIVIIPAGSRRQPDQSRLDLMRTNVGILDQAIDVIKEVNPECIIITVTNPVDVLNLRAFKRSGFPRERVIGLGNLVDTVRFRSYLAERFGWYPRDVMAFLCGEHGDSMVPIWSQASYAGVRFDKLEGFDYAGLEEVYQKIRKTGAEMIRLKGGASWAVAAATTELVRAIAQDERRPLPVSVIPGGAYGINLESSISLPVIIGRNGIRGFLQAEFSPEEVEGLHNSAKIVMETYKQIEG